MLRGIPILILLGFYCLIGFSQSIDTEYDRYYLDQINELKSNYIKADIKTYQEQLYMEWLAKVAYERISLENQTGNPFAQLEAQKLAEKQKEIQAAMAGEVIEEEIAEMEESNNLEKSMYQSTEEFLDSSREEQPISDVEEISKEDKIAEEEFKEKESTPNSLLDFEANFDKPIPGVYFRIQVIASKYNLKPEEVQNRILLKEEVIHEQNSGLHKYLVGKFSNYQSARQMCDEIKSENKVNSFVVAYKNERRVAMNVLFSY